MSRYVQVLAVQRPFPFNTDENGRVMFSCNFDAVAAGPVEQWEEEVVSVLSGAGLATLNTDAFIGPAAILPKGDGPYITVIDTGGLSPVETHNGSIYERLSAQIVVRAAKYRVARTRALAIWRALDGLRNETVAA